MEVVTFRPRRRQILYLALFTIAVAVVALAILASRYVADAGLSGKLLSWGFAAAIGAPIAGWVLFRYGRAFTECSPAGIRSRGLTREWRCSWEYVREIAIRPSNNPRGPAYNTVIVCTTGDDRLLLGMPVTGGIMPDPDFEAKVRRIRAYWHSAIGADSSPAADSAIPMAPAAAPRLTVVTAVRFSVGLALIGAVVAVPFALRADGPALLARLGHGQSGSFTASAYTCESGNCFWVGDFRTRDGSTARAGVPMAPGAAIGRAGQRVPAVYPGKGDLVYPAGGGPSWIPLALLLVIIVGCVPPVTVWLVGWRRSTRSAADYLPHPVAQPAGGRSLAPAGVAIIVCVEIVAMTVAGAAIGYWAGRVPVAVSPPTLACADYSAWVQDQPAGSSMTRDQALLAEAEQKAPPLGSLRVDLATLASDVTTATEATNTDENQIVQLNIANDLTVVTSACN